MRHHWELWMLTTEYKMMLYLLWNCIASTYSVKYMPLGTLVNVVRLIIMLFKHPVVKAIWQTSHIIGEILRKFTKRKQAVCSQLNSICTWLALLRTWLEILQELLLWVLCQNTVNNQLSHSHYLLLSFYKCHVWSSDCHCRHAGCKG